MDEVIFDQQHTTLCLRMHSLCGIKYYENSIKSRHEIYFFVQMELPEKSLSIELNERTINFDKFTPKSIDASLLAAKNLSYTRRMNNIL